MRRTLAPTRALATALCCTVVGGCSFFDSGIEWRSGSYALLWIDDPQDVALSFDRGAGGWPERVAPQVFAVGEDDHYIVVKQHPSRNKNITNYFIIDRTNDSANSDPKTAVIGPLTSEEFAVQSTHLHLPLFSTVLASLQ